VVLLQDTYSVPPYDLFGLETAAEVSDIK
jgi:hypothetical protein